MAWFKKIVIISMAAAVLVISVTAVWLLVFLNTQPAPRTVRLQVGTRVIDAEIVSRAADLYRGLSGRPALCPGCGMLFDFPDAAEREFVMRDMNFPLDIIFLNGQKIIKIAADLPPESPASRTIYSSDGPSDRVLEINAGAAKDWGLRPGDPVRELDAVNR